MKKGAVSQMYHFQHFVYIISYEIDIYYINQIVSRSEVVTKVAVRESWTLSLYMFHYCKFLFL